MSMWMFLKSFGDLCLYFGVLGAFPGLFTHSFAFLWPVLLCSFGVWVASSLSLNGKSAFRYLGLALCCTPLVLVATVMDFLVLILPIGYCAGVILRQQLSVDYAEYRLFFLRAMGLYGLFFLVVSLYTAFETMLLLKEMTLNYQVPFQYGLLYGISAVLLLRMLRLGRDVQGVNRIYNVLFMGGTAVVLVGAVFLERYLRELDTSVYQELFIKVSSSLVVPLFWLFDRVKQILPEIDGEIPETVESSQPSGTGTVQVPPTAEPAPQPLPPEEMGFPWWIVVLILMMMAVILGVMLRMYAKRKAAVRSAETVESLRPEKKREILSRRSNRSRVRQLYREFLKHQRSRGVRLRTDHTSRDILDQISADTDPDGASQLRQVYLKARYDTAHKVSKEQLEEGKEALKKSIG